VELAEAAAEGGGGADGAEEGPAAESRAGEGRDGRETEEYLAEKVIVERAYGGGSWRRRRSLWGGHGCEFTELEEPVQMHTHRLHNKLASKQQQHEWEATDANKLKPA